MPTDRTRTAAHRPASRLLAAVATSLVLLTASGCAAAAEAPPPAPPQSQPGGRALTAGDVDAWLDGVLPTALAQTGIPGASVSVVADGRIVTARGYGMADTGTETGTPRPVDPEQTLFRMGSVSKLATATAAMQLVEQGRIDLDEDVAQHLGVDVPTPLGAVTMRHLLTHTAGFEEKIRGLILPPGAEPVLRDVIATDPPAQVYAPGTTPAYSNFGNALAGYVVERVSGQPFEEYLAEHVFAPTGMTSSSFAQPLPADLDARLAKGYPDDSRASLPSEVVGTAPAGSMAATATDMARFMIAQLGGGEGVAPLLAPDTLEEMHTPALGADQLGTLARGQLMALGFFDEGTEDVPAVGHGGDTQVFHTALRIFPEDGAGIFVALNGSGRDAMDPHELREVLLSGFADRYLADDAASTTATSPTTTDASTDAGAAEAVAGTYGTSRSPVRGPGAMLDLSGQTVVTARQDGTIAVTPRPGGVGTGVYAPDGPDRWRQVGGDAVLATRTADGRVDAVSWGGAFTMLRLDTAHTASVAVPVLLASLAVLLLGLLALPARALLRTGPAAPVTAGAAVRVGRAERVSVLTTRLGMVAGLVAVAGWAAVAVAVTGFQDVPTAAVRALQVVQGLALLAALPAAAAAVLAVRSRRRVPVVLGRVLVVAALLGLGWFAVTWNLVSAVASY